ncbi:hypothetical protein [Paraburkholderia sp. SOS3]|jgi:hypothetical protein|uniref:hypothetical protein n=1 Tax=Paraburkholderia sp. SOS3 TaxID=1926494 RepID=UPI0009477DA9|nr:hypothetical protein [Paraburkholderia sp. SOS3]APR38043.1 hypothetical protein BTO02_21130 [Paraburkholderia sp. SOS3]
MTGDAPEKRPESGAPDAEHPDLEHLDAAVTHVGEMVQSGHIAISAARGILYSLIETLGTLVGDPDLPEHARAGYEGLLETARELRAKVEH